VGILSEGREGVVKVIGNITVETRKESWSSGSVIPSRARLQL
jgi:hypothetical protein